MKVSRRGEILSQEKLLEVFHKFDNFKNEFIWVTKMRAILLKD